MLNVNIVICYNLAQQMNLIHLLVEEKSICVGRYRILISVYGKPFKFVFKFISRMGGTCIYEITMFTKMYP